MISIGGTYNHICRLLKLVARATLRSFRERRVYIIIFIYNLGIVMRSRSAVPVNGELVHHETIRE